jgi:glycosyltransferase involved in cell wall biosynthesis
MNILVVNHYVGTPVDGIGDRHYMFAKELIKRGHDVTIISSSFDHGTRTETHLNEGEKWKRQVEEGVPFVWVRTPPYTGNGLDRAWNMLCFGLRINRWAERFRLERPDVVVGSSPHLFAASGAQRLARRYNVPFVLEIRDLWPETLIELGNFSPRNPGIRVLERIERRLYRSADHIMCLLPGGAEHICEKGGQKGKITWIPNGIDLKVVPTPYPRDDSLKFVVMYAGAHGLANGLDSILDTASILKQQGWSERVVFRFVGDGPHKARLAERACTEGLDMVQFEPYVPRREIYSLLQEADAFVITLRDANLFSRYGVSPNKLFDYLASARPVIFAIDSLNNPVAESGGGITVPPEDPESMAQAIIRLANMSSQARWEMGLKGRRYVEQEYDYAKLADRIETVLYDVSGSVN